MIRTFSFQRLNSFVSYDLSPYLHGVPSPYPDPLPCGQWQEQIQELFRVPLILSGGFYDFLLKVVLKDLDEYNKFVFEKLTKVLGIVKMQSSFVLSEIKHKTALDIKL